jgi:hypothetical protein
MADASAERRIQAMARIATSPGHGVPASRKYDLLTAIALGGLSGGAMRETLALRLIALITARYDWARDQVTIGQAELQRLWAVSRRTVIRDLAELRRIGALTLIDAGRRGRVARYRLCHDRLAAMLAPSASRAGNALEARLRAPEPEQDPGQGGDMTAAQRDAAEIASAPCAGEARWMDVRDRVAGEIGAAAATRWLAPLRAAACDEQGLRLTAPTRFHADYVARVHGWRIETAASVLAGARRVVIVAARG